MKQQPTDITKMVRVLYNARPMFVSLVDSGANQTPFKVLKADLSAESSDEDLSDMTRKTTVRTAPKKKSEDYEFMASLTKAGREMKSGEKAVVLQRIDFEKESYPTKAAVEEYLKANNYTSFEILEDQETGVYTTKAHEVDVFVPDSLRVVKSNDAGVNFIVGFVQKAEEPVTETPTPEAQSLPASAAEAIAETIEPKQETASKQEASEASEVKDPAPTPEAEAKKFDTWSAADSSSPDFKEVFKAGQDGVPPGFNDLLSVYITSIVNGISAKDPEAVKTASIEFADLIVSVTAMYDEKFKAAVKAMKQKQEAAQAPPEVETAKQAAEEPKELDKVVQALKSIVDEKFGELDTRIQTMESYKKSRNSSGESILGGTRTPASPDVVEMQKAEKARAIRNLKTTMGFYSPSNNSL